MQHDQLAYPRRPASANGGRNPVYTVEDTIGTEMHKHRRVAPMAITQHQPQLTGSATPAGDHRSYATLASVASDLMAALKPCRPLELAWL